MDYDSIHKHNHTNNVIYVWVKKMKGKHLIIDMNNCAQLPTYTEVYELLEQIVGTIQMNKLAGPFIFKGAPHNPGITGMTIIDTSHIAIHTFTETNTIAMDIYSCKTFKHDKVLKDIKKLFKPKTIRYKVFAR